MIAVPLRKSVARIWLWFDDEPTDDIPPINRWRFDIAEGGGPKDG